MGLQNVSVVGTKCQLWRLHLGEAIRNTAYPRCSTICITLSFVDARWSLYWVAFCSGSITPFFSLGYVSIKTSFLVTSNDKDSNGRCCSRPNRCRASRDAHMATRWFLWFWLRLCGSHTPDFEPCPLNTNVTRWWNGHSSSHLPVLEYTDVDHCGLMCLNDLHQTSKVFLNV